MFLDKRLSVTRRSMRSALLSCISSISAVSKPFKDAFFSILFSFCSFSVPNPTPPSVRPHPTAAVEEVGEDEEDDDPPEGWGRAGCALMALVVAGSPPAGSCLICTSSFL